MKSSKISQIIQSGLEAIYCLQPDIRAPIEHICSSGGIVLFVGGVVRDMFLSQPIKDIDIEVHGLDAKKLEKILAHYGPVLQVGKSFGVFKVAGMSVDWALPRSDSSGRKPHVVVDPYMSYQQAFARRDLTINAMGIDAYTHELIDPFGGLLDIERKVLRAPSIKFFVQDPLRFFRVMQFIARFQMSPDYELQDVCSTMDVSTVSQERIEQECNKMILKSAMPSLGFRWLRTIDRLQDLFPELYATIGVEQRPDYHPEGDVFEHSMQSLDVATQITCSSEYERLVLCYAALCHDFGKVTTTKKIDGVIISYGHAQAGVHGAQTFLKKVVGNKYMINTIVRLIACHMQPLQLVASGAKPSAYKRLASRLAPYTTIVMLAKLCIADRSGRALPGRCPLAVEDELVRSFLYNAQQALVEQKPEAPWLTGKDFLDVVAPGPLLGKLVRKAYELQIEGAYQQSDLKQAVLDFFAPEIKRAGRDH